MKKIFIRALTAVSALCVCASVMLPAITAGAVSYSGSGTLSDPYIVQTAEQLQGMRENLSAHYKLANTIDLSGVDFKPIGRLDAPFTGSFVCELNAEKTPKYIIKNLKVQVADSTYAAEKKNKWEAALFGAAEGATISGIYVLDAYIRCEVLGDNQGAVIYGTYKPGMDEMNSAILIGEANMCNVSNCGTTGKIDTRASGVGGLIGRAANCTVENCYSTAEVVTEGKWSVGGLIGVASGGSVSSCFATGNVQSVQGNASAFIETVSENVNVTNCYAAGNTKSVAVDHHGTGGGSAFISVEQDEKPDATLKNCFSLGSASVAGTYNYTIESCYSLSGTIANTAFITADMAAIKSALTGLSEWDASGDQPKLTGIGIVTDSSAYQAGVVETPVTNSTASQGAAGTQSAGATETVSQAISSVEDIIEMIDALPEADEVTLDDKDAVKEAWNAYDALGFAEKEDFDSDAFSKLSQVRYKLSLLLANYIVNCLKELPEDTADFSKEDVELVLSLYDDYLFLDDTVREEFQPEYLEILENAYEYASNYDASAVSVNSGLTTTEIIIVVISIVIILLTVAFYTFATIVYFRKSKRLSSEELETEEDLEVTEE